VERPQAQQHANQHGPSAVDLQLGHILAGEAAWGWTGENDPAIQDLAVFRIADPGKARDPQLKNTAGQPAERRARVQPRNDPAQRPTLCWSRDPHHAFPMALS
jgi:hypothetical protein